MKGVSCVYVAMTTHTLAGRVDLEILRSSGYLAGRLVANWNFYQQYS